MEITEKWIAKAAGWKANKEGRDLFKQGAVIDSNRKDHIITGTLSSGVKPTRVTVKIHSDTDIDTVCPRVNCRRTGEICGHAVALMLHSISEKTPKQPTPEELTPRTTKNTCIPLRIDLPPTFPEGIKGGQAGLGAISAKLSPREAEPISGIDQAFTDWLVTNTGKSSPSLLGLRGSQALDFLRCIAGHPHIFVGDGKISIHDSDTRIPMELERDHDRLKVCLSDTTTKHRIAWHVDDNFYLWDKEQRYLMIQDVSQLWKPRYWQRIAEGNSVSMPLTEFVKSLDTQNDLINWDNDQALSNIPISAADPSFTLVLDGSTQLLTAQLRANYTSDDSLTIGLHGDCDIQFPIVDPEETNHFLSRNRDAEDMAAGKLMQAGFHIIDPRGTWQIASEDAIIEFLTATLPSLESESKWKIQSSSKLNSLKNNIIRITPSFDFKGGEVQHSGQDWLAFDVNFKTSGGKEIPKDVIQRMLAGGKRSGTSKNGKRVIISNFDADTVETVLRDTNPKQENGLYYAPKAQGSYLKRLQHYYSNKSLAKPDQSIIKHLPISIQETLRPYQEEGIAWLYERATNDGAALLADDMGLGKTLQTLALIHLLKNIDHTTSSANKRMRVQAQPKDKRMRVHAQPKDERMRVQALIICPTSLLGNWQEECSKFFPTFKTLVLHGAKRKDYFSVMHSADIVITSYALIARDLDFYSAQKFHTLVIDEASLIRNPDTQAAKSLRKLTANHRIALTGTPVENAVRDLWSLFHFLLPGYLGSRKDFQHHYQQPLSNNSPDPAIMKRLRMRIEPFMLRRTKTNVAKDLPPKILQTIYCEPSASQKQTYTKLLKQGAQKVADMSADMAGAARIQILTVLLRLRQAATDLRLLDSEMEISMDEASGKMIRLIELLREAKEGNHRVLIFSQFTTMLTLIKKALTESDISYAYLDGSTKDRAKEVEKFQSPTGPDTFLISLKAGGYGLNLTAADTVIHFDPWWNPAVEAQATDRAYRIGQTKPTTVYKLVTKGTVEEKIVRLQQAKQGLIDSTLGGDGADDEPLMQGLSQLEISSLLTQ